MAFKICLSDQSLSMAGRIMVSEKPRQHHCTHGLSRHESTLRLLEELVTLFVNWLKCLASGRVYFVARKKLLGFPAGSTCITGDGALLNDRSRRDQDSAH
jgi:hypothetical protein